MKLAEFIERVKVLPKDKRAEVYDFVEFLAWRESLSLTAREQEHADWSEADFSAMAMQQAMRGLEDEPTLYDEDDLVERWK
ncbi:MAG: DUF2281 domain-containing protein [Nitrococcus mobilis]|nr:DUF2281 domain-containing protein [Nitrococcus mobilis]